MNLNDKEMNQLKYVVEMANGSNNIDIVIEKNGHKYCLDGNFLKTLQIECNENLTNN